MIAPPTALEASGQRSKLVAARAAGIASVAVGCLILVLVVIGWPVLHRHYEKTQDRFDRHPGMIRTVSRDDGDTDDGVVSVQHGGLDGPRVTVRVHDVDDWWSGQRVTFLVDPDDPTFVTLPGENFLPEWFIPAIFFGFVTTAVLVFGGAAVWTRSHQLLVRKARSPWGNTFGTAMTVGSGDSTMTVAYFRAFAPDRLWRLSKQVPPGAVVAEIAGDRSGAVVRVRGRRREILAKPLPLESRGLVELRLWERGKRVTAMRLGADVYCTQDREFGDELDGREPPIMATLLVHEPDYAVLTLDAESRSVLLSRVKSKAARKQWAEPAGRS